MVLLDSSGWIEAPRAGGDPRVKQQVGAWLAADQVLTCGPVMAEVLRGVREPDVQKTRARFADVRYLETRDTDWRTVIEAARALSNTAQHVPLVDILIAAMAARVPEAVAAHLDAHYPIIQTVLPFAEHRLALSVGAAP